MAFSFVAMTVSYVLDVDRAVLQLTRYLADSTRIERTDDEPGSIRFRRSR